MNAQLISALVAALVAVIVVVKKQQGPSRRQKSATNNAQGVASSNVPKGIKVFMSGRYKEAFEILEPAAQNDNLRAQKLVAKMYLGGNGVAADQEQYLLLAKASCRQWRQAVQNKSQKIDVKKYLAHGLDSKVILEVLMLNSG